MNALPATRLDDFTSPLDDDVPAPSGLADFATVPELWEPGTVIGHRYRIGRVLDVGGMATVYQATQLDLDRPVAIKVPRNGAADSPGAQRFQREARVLAELQHPHIVSVFELGWSEQGASFMAMEFIEGPALRAQLAAEGPLHWRTAATVAAQLAEALQFAHASGVVHGDVSARNVLLLRRGDSFESKLIDFGVARKAGDLPQRTLGTRQYVAPELFRGQAPHFLSDVYALGALLREMVGDAISASPGLLQTLIASMLDDDPLCRPESAGVVAMRLRAVLEAQAAAPPSLPTLYADPEERAGRGSGALHPARPSRRRWVVTGSLTGMTLCGLVAYGFRPLPAPSLATGVAGSSVAAPAIAVAPLKDIRFVPPAPPAPPASPTPPPRVSQSNTAVAAAVSTRVSAPTPSPSVETAAAHSLPDGESAARETLVASLDQWFVSRNEDGSGDYPPQTVTRVGDPIIAFDPRGSSASVTYRAVVMYSDGNRGAHSIVEKQVFFAKRGEAWQMIDPDR